jgi:hypothetical protein
MNTTLQPTTVTMTERDRLAIIATTELLPEYCKKLNFDIIERAYAIADKTLKDIERAKKNER